MSGNIPHVSRLNNAVDIIAVAALALVFLALVWFALIRPGVLREQAAEARAGRVVAEGSAKAAQDAAGVVVGQAKQETDSASLDAANEAAIRGGANPRERLCLRDAYRDQPACIQLRNAGP